MKNITYKRITVIMISMCLAAGIVSCKKDKDKADTDIQEEYF